MDNIQITSEDDFRAAVLSILPDAEFGEDNDGQVIIYTNCDWMPMQVAGRVNPPLPPVEPDMVRLVVLNDGETFTDATGCSIVDMPVEYDIDAMEGALCSVNEPNEDPNMVYVGGFTANGVVKVAGR